jgi:hypothetical protein
MTVGYQKMHSLATVQQMAGRTKSDMIFLDHAPGERSPMKEKKATDRRELSRHTAEETLHGSP